MRLQSAHLGFRRRVLPHPQTAREVRDRILERPEIAVRLHQHAVDVEEEQRSHRCRRSNSALTSSNVTSRAASSTSR